ncbi:MAG: hypothetical protein DMF71_11210 [Acidobacteria bacterium]|nr:MAG: hypothetical protein DMF71_11210 [Acidobacteriota bacterium]
MRRVSVTTPEGKADEVAQIAFSVGISSVSVQQNLRMKSNASRIPEDALQVDTSTPLAKAFIDKLMTAPFFNCEDYSIVVRQPRSIVTHDRLVTLTRPLVEPVTDIFEELWQFSQITSGFVGRIFIGGLLLAYGMIEYKLLFMIAGLLFIPLLPLMLAAGFGIWTRQFRLVGQGVFALAVAIVLLMLGGIVVALFTGPPLRFNEFSSLPVSLMISLIVGVAAGLATADDVGRREMIGLAATAQIAILPAWFGICFVLGFPQVDSAPPINRALGLLANVAVIVVAALVTYAAIGMKGSALRVFEKVSDLPKSRGEA